MNSAERLQLQQILMDRSGNIATEWHKVISRDVSTTHSMALVRQHLKSMTEQLFRLLLTESLDISEAQGIGTELIRLRFMRPEVLSTTQRILNRQVWDILPPALYLRWGDLLGEFAIGFTKQLSQTILSEQEQIRAAVDAQRDQAQKAKESVERRNRAILQAQPDLLTITHLDGEILYYHGHPDRLLLPVSDVLGKNLRDLLPHDLNSAFQKIFQKVLRTGQMVVHEYSLEVRGEIRHFEARVVPYLDNQVLSIIRDITKRRNAEMYRAESDARYRAVVEDQTELISRWLPDTTFTFVNDAYCRYFGKSRERLIGRSLRPLIYKADLPAFNHHLASLQNLPPDNPSAIIELRAILPSGEVRWQQWLHRAIFDEDGHLTEFQSVGRDITDLKNNREALEQMNARLQQMTRQLITTQEEERHRIARDLHDDVLNHLGVLAFTIEDTTESEKYQKHYQDLIKKLRITIGGLRPPMLNFGLRAALVEYIDDLSDQQANGFDVELEIPPNGVRFNANVELHLFRIIQEACVNVVKHSQCKNLRIFGRIQSNRVNLTVADDGNGFEIEEKLNLEGLLAEGCFGLAGMIERGALIHADVTISSVLGRGTLVNVKIESPILR